MSDTRSLIDLAERLDDMAGAASYGQPNTPEAYERWCRNLLAIASRIRVIVEEENAYDASHA